MFLYPLAVVLMLLTFTSSLFNHSRVVYIAATAVAFMISVIDGLKTLCALLEIENFGWMNPIIKFYKEVLPLYDEGLGWLLPVLAIMFVTGVLVRLVRTSTVHA